MNSPVHFDHIAPEIKGLAGRLIGEGVLTTEQARDAENDARAMHVSLTRYLIDTLDVDSHELAEMASVEFGVPIFDLAAMNLDMLPVASDRFGTHGQAPCGSPLPPRPESVRRGIRSAQPECLG